MSYVYLFVVILPVPEQPPYEEPKNIQPYQTQPPTPPPPNPSPSKGLRSYEHHSYTPNKVRKEEQWKELEALVEKGLFDERKYPSESLKVRSFTIFLRSLQTILFLNPGSNSQGSRRK